MIATILSPIATRFAWKEFRTLRGFWIAAFVLGALVEWFFLAVHARPPEIGWPTTLFIVALCTSALYAIGVAATTFSMEHEDETYSFLTGLPIRWLPIFAGKMWFALASALALAVALTIVGCLATGGQLPGLNDAAFALGSFGFLIVEAIVWGTLFSLLLRQPLLSALLAIAAVSASLSLLTTSFVEGHLSSLNASSYVAVLPQRILLAAGIFLANVLLARNWLVLERRARRSATSDSDGGDTISRRARAWARLRARVRPVYVRNFQLRMFGHLLWQTWRQSWRWMLGMPAAGLLLCYLLYIVSYGPRLHWLETEEQMAVGPFLILLAISGLYACGIFLADQRLRSYRFLAEHAAWPRVVWLARLTVWLIPVVAIIAVSGILVWNLAIETQRQWQRAFVDIWRASEWPGDRYLLAKWQENGVFLRSSSFAVWGIALGLALGQACSMFFRRPLVAGLAVSVAAVPLIVLAILLWVWDLPPVRFLLPIVLGCLLATWLRVPDWLVERNTLRAWGKVALALVLPFLYVLWLLPASRQLPRNADQIVSHQIAYTLGVPWEKIPSLGPPPDFVQLADRWVENSGITCVPAEQATADRLIRLAELIEDPRKVPDENGNYNRRESKAAFRKRIEANRKIVDEAAEIAGNDYRFPLKWDTDAILADAPNPTIGRLFELANLLEDAARDAINQGQLDQALDYLLAEMTLTKRLGYLQTDSWFYQQIQLMFDWAAAKGQTALRIKRAIAALDTLRPEVSNVDVREGLVSPGFASMDEWTPPSFLAIQYILIRDVINGKDTSQLITSDTTWREFVAIHLNELPFERKRALTILADVFADQTAQWYRAARLTNQRVLHEQARMTNVPLHEDSVHDYANELRRLVLNANANDHLVDQLRYSKPPLSWMRASLLLQRLFEQSIRHNRWWLQAFVSSRVQTWGMRQQLALIAYRLDHGKYPDSLDALVPDYLPFVPIDPFSGGPFEYRPQGLELPFRAAPAGTPLLWSVDAANFRLVRRPDYEPLPEDSIRRDEPIASRREVYDFESSGPYFYNSEPAIFWLPK